MNTGHPQGLSASELGIIPHDPERERLVAALAAGKADAHELLKAWLHEHEKKANITNLSVATIGLMIDLAAVYEEAGLAKTAQETYADAREAAWHEHMDGIIRTLDAKLKRFQTFG